MAMSWFRREGEKLKASMRRRESYQRQLAERGEHFTLGWGYGLWLALGEAVGNTSEHDHATLALAEAAQSGRVLAALQLLDRLQEVDRHDEAAVIARLLDEADVDVPAELLDTGERIAKRRALEDLPF